MDLNDLYEYAGHNGVVVNCFKMLNCKSLSVCDENGHCFIAMNPFAQNTTAEERVQLAHELGHCLAGGFYGEGTDICERRRSERRANIFAYRLLVDKKELQNLIKNGDTSVWELAERFNVTDEFMADAIEYYKNN